MLRQVPQGACQRKLGQIYHANGTALLSCLKFKKSSLLIQHFLRTYWVSGKNARMRSLCSKGCGLVESRPAREYNSVRDSQL